MSASDAGSKRRNLARSMLKRPYRYWLLAILLAVLIYYAWTEITRTRGDQKVSFVPAAQACGAAGSLRYCVYRDRRGTNGDIVYHLHGRNLNERIWNDGTYFTAMLQGEWQRSRALPLRQFRGHGAACRHGASARSQDGVACDLWRALRDRCTLSGCLPSFVGHLMAYALALHEARVPVDLHLYAKGGRAFGMRPTAAPITTEWPRQVKQWLHNIGVL